MTAMLKKSKSTILIVDDESMCIKFLVELLKNDYTLLVAKDAFFAIELIKKQTPDLILSDIDMPDMTGYELLKSLKLLNLTRPIPTIFFTGRDRVTDEAEGLRLGAIDYIKKGTSADIIKYRVRNHINAINNPPV